MFPLVHIEPPAALAPPGDHIAYRGSRYPLKIPTHCAEEPWPTSGRCNAVPRTWSHVGFPPTNTTNCVWRSAPIQARGNIHKVLTPDSWLPSQTSLYLETFWACQFITTYCSLLPYKLDSEPWQENNALETQQRPSILLWMIKTFCCQLFVHLEIT